MPPSDQAKKDPIKLAKAKLALSDQAEIDDWKKDSEELEKRRAEAAKAMASEEQKKAWAEEEKKKKEKIEAQKKLANLEATRRLEEIEKKKKLSEEQRQQDEEKEKERLNKIEEIIKSRQEIESIKKGPYAGPQAIRTLTRDIGGAIKSEKLSVSKIVTKTPDQARPVAKNRSWLVGLSLILVIVGLSIAVWSLIQRQTSSLAPQVVQRQSLILADQQININWDNLNKDQLISSLSEIKANPSNNKVGKLAEVYFTYQVSSTTDKGIITWQTEANPTDYNNRLNLKLPDSFLRFIDKKWLFGFWHEEQTTPIYIFKTEDYRNVADSLLKNEGDIIGSLLSPFIDASSTDQIATSSFKDKMIKNYDTRLITDEANNTIAIYSWLDQKTLLITTNENTFAKILDSYSSPK